MSHITECGGTKLK